MKIELRENGPLKIEGGESYTLTLGDQETTLEKPAIFLCRCGHSANKPFCDGAHKNPDLGFVALAGQIESL
jgi:CDGSH iron-sulfur domain-containing protein 3